MKFLRLLFKNLMRNRRRTFLTLTSIAVSVFLIATLRTVLTELENPPETPDSALRLITRHKVSLANSLPIAHRAKIAEIEGVEAVIGSMWFGGIYKDPSNFFANFAVDVDQFFQVTGDVKIPEDQKKAFLVDRTGAMVGRKLAKRFDWEVGDTVHLKGTIFPLDPELTIRGIYESESDEATLYFHWEYFNEGMNNQSFTGTFWIKARTAEDIPRITEQVDALFQNSTAPTKTETEKAFILGFVEMMGNVQFLITSIVLVVIFAVVLVAANTMAMSIRERIREIGILKALGFRRIQILLLLMGEAILLTGSASLLGSFAARMFYSAVDMAETTGGMLQRFHVTSGTLILCAAIGLAVGILSAGVPAWNASQRPVVDALRRVI